MASLKTGLSYVTEHSEAVTSAIDMSTKKALASCILSITKLKSTLKLEDDDKVNNVLSMVGTLSSSSEQRNLQ